MATGTQVEKELITVTHEKIPNEVVSKILHKNFCAIGTHDFSEEDIEAGLKIQRDMGVEEVPMGKSIPDVKLRSMPTNDTTEYSWYAPTEILLVETAPSGIGWHNWAVTKFAGGEAGKKAVLTASKVLACTALEMLLDDSLLDAAKEELSQRLNGRTYQPLFEDDVMPNLTINKKAMDPFYKKG